MIVISAPAIGTHASVNPGVPVSPSRFAVFLSRTPPLVWTSHHLDALGPCHSPPAPLSVMFTVNVMVSQTYALSVSLNVNDTVSSTLSLS